MQDIVTYLNRSDVSPFYSKLLKVLSETKQGRAPVEQWRSMIGALPQKGVKPMEIEESGAKAWLDLLGPKDVLTKEELLSEIQRRYYTVKEVQLASPKFRGWHQPGGEYGEWLYVANSEAANVEDAIEQVEYEMSALIFEMERVLDDPELPVRLANERAKLMAQRGKAIEFPSHHFSDAINGKHGKNLLAHCRVTRRDNLFFIEEIQSDWAQRGRKADWKGYPVGPLVTNTEAWVNMVLRRQLQLAAQDPRVQRVAWITESMRNGGEQNLAQEQRKAKLREEHNQFVEQRLAELMAQSNVQAMEPQQAQAAKDELRARAVREAYDAGHHKPSDNLNDFYLEVVPKLVNKLLGKSGAKVGFADLNVGGRQVKVPSFEMTDAARALLKESQPLYSRAPLVPFSRTLPELEPAIERAVGLVTRMLGSAHAVRLATHLYDVASGREVAGRYDRGYVELSLRAEDLEAVAAHESFHFATERLMTLEEVRVVKEAFAPGTQMNGRIQLMLRAHGLHDAADQCADWKEASAHAFSMWHKGAFALRAPEVDPQQEGVVTKVFSSVKQALVMGARWLRSMVAAHQANQATAAVRRASAADSFLSLRKRAGILPNSHDAQAVSPEDVVEQVFGALRDGLMAVEHQRRAFAQEEPAQRQGMRADRAAMA